jgi:Domain of unknown function (DUF4333)
MVVRSRSAGVLVVLLAGLLVSCHPTLLDSDGLERQLATQIERELGLTGLTVVCPDDVEVKAKATFTCTATGEGGANLTVNVTQTNDEGDVTWTVVDAA